jgi:hypothetical protein
MSEVDDRFARRARRRCRRCKGGVRTVEQRRLPGF